MKMSDFAYILKYLTGLNKEEDGKHCSGKFTGCTKILVEGFLAVSSCSFVRTASHIKGESKRFKTDGATKSSIFFSHTNGAVPIPFNGYPFEVIATEKWTCNETSTVNKNEKLLNIKRKIEDHVCKASIQIRTVRVYADYGLSKDCSLSDADLQKAKDEAKQKLLKAFAADERIKWTDVHYCRFPLETAHTHPQTSTRSNATQLDKRVIGNIRDLARSGISDVQSIRSMAEDFVYNTMFAHASEQEKPKPGDRRYFPTVKTIRNHIFLGKVSNISNYRRIKTCQSEEIHPASITNVVEMPLKEGSMAMAVKRRQKVDVGFIAVHAGAGFHSDERWPGYKHLCKTVCVRVREKLKQGLTAGEAATMAVKLLEDSELTNAGFGSNLTESGKIECDASVMDTTPSSDPCNQCDSYFGSVACVNKVRNPVSAAYKLLDERRRRRRLELGRIPPSFLVSEGAENWSLAHGVETCEEDDLISESAHKSWQKYHGKLLRKLTSQNQIRESDPHLEEHTNSRLDTVGAVALDLDGNVAAAVSSGGLLLKLPGRVGQAALYGCGCWVEPMGSNRPAVAVTTSGCGEQLVSTMLAKKCAENLQSQERPYQALQDTLTEDFLGSSMLSSECDKQGGLLCLHQTLDGSQCTVEVVWGHTTSSMVVGLMSTNDANPKVILSRLPDNATPGKSVTVGGSWTKVECSEQIEMRPPESDDEGNNAESFENDVVVNSVDGVWDDTLHEESIDPDISIMFASPVPEGLTESSCGVELSGDFDRKINLEFEKSIEERWEARKAENPRLFNAQKFRIHSVRFEANDQSAPRLTFCLGLTCYRDYMETNWAKEVANLKEKGEKEHSNSQAYLAEPLGVAAIIITDDHKVIFQWRNSWLAEGAGMLDVPGGHPEPSDAAEVDSRRSVSFADLQPDKVVREIFHSQVKEVRDEVNVPLEKIGTPILTGLVRNNQSGGRPVAYFYMRCHMTSDEIMTHYRAGGPETDESTNLEFVPERDIANLRIDKPQLWSKMCPNGKAASVLYSMLKKKQAKPSGELNEPK